MQLQFHWEILDIDVDLRFKSVGYILSPGTFDLFCYLKKQQQKIRNSLQLE
jgi:hypothetical protein